MNEIFNLKTKEKYNPSPMADEFLKNMLMQLVEKNRERINSCTSAQYTWCQSAVQFIFNVCNKVKLKKHVKYVALEIYEKFTAEHFSDTYENYFQCAENPSLLEFETVEKRMKKLNNLRLLSSIQLASKLESRVHYLRPFQVKEFLQEIGETYDTETLISSELRILFTLDNQVDFSTTAHYVELYMYILYTNDQNIDSIYDHCQTILDFVYLHRTQLYDELYDFVSSYRNNRERISNEKFLKVKADYMLLGISIIAATVYLYMNESYELILEELHKLTGKAKANLKCFSAVIINLVSRNKKLLKKQVKLCKNLH